MTKKKPNDFKDNRRLRDRNWWSCWVEATNPHFHFFKWNVWSCGSSLCFEFLKRHFPDEMCCQYNKHIKTFEIFQKLYFISFIFICYTLSWKCGEIFTFFEKNMLKYSIKYSKTITFVLIWFVYISFGNWLFKWCWTRVDGMGLVVWW